ncbi:MAG: hypothetical protein A2X78_02450 [Gammaproteobacteria bacterium GWE2_37_16]|nr:MAG: hypothetical protein A2X78_02450 [Gammaproteobacteria bacterium GWE2_37_16]
MSKINNRRVVDYLSHIIHAIHSVNDYTEDLIEITFLENELVQDAVIRNLEIIGEASRNIDYHYPDFSVDYPKLPLKVAYEMRNVLAHGYFSVDLEIVWQTIQNDLPELENQVKRIYQEFKDKKSC